MKTSKSSKYQLMILTLAALGVVYGDIGTSPLYAVNEVFFGHAKLLVSQLNVLGTISLIFWALTLTVSLKYVIFVLRADNDGEGGVFALYSLIQSIKEKKPRAIIILSSLLIFAAGLLFGDGIITPAISVLSAVEGLKVATNTLAPYVIPLTIVILTFLFLIQQGGTAKIGKIFGPIVLVWFAVIAVLGIKSIISFPGVVAAVNPIYAINFLKSAGVFNIFWVLGAVMLTITGGEAMYADMGHFGKKPIRISWFSVVFPALLLNYFGQGALLLKGMVTHQNIFYSMVPSWGVIPMVVLATAATVIASQALISGAFSLATQAVALGLLPTLKIIHTHEHHEGQRYVPFINWSLYFGCVILVLLFQSSANLASAYGLAVSGVMLVTTMSMIYVSRNLWGWARWQTAALFIPLAFVDLLFFSANSLKIVEGGFIPLLIALSIWTVMKIWHWGHLLMRKTLAKEEGITVNEIVELKKREKNYLPKAIVFLSKKQISEKGEIVPGFKEMFLNRYGLLPRDLVFLTVRTVKSPRIKGNRYIINKFFEEKGRGSIVSVVVQFGFMEEPRVEYILERLAKHKDINIDEDHKKWLVHALNERVTVRPSATGFKRIVAHIYRLLYTNSATADQYFGLGHNVNLSIEIVPIRIE